MRAADYDYRRGLLESRLRFWLTVPSAAAMVARLEAEISSPAGVPAPGWQSPPAPEKPSSAPRQPAQGPIVDIPWTDEEIPSSAYAGMVPE